MTYFVYICAYLLIGLVISNAIVNNQYKSIPEFLLFIIFWPAILVLAIVGITTYLIILGIEKILMNHGR